MLEVVKIVNKNCGIPSVSRVTFVFFVYSQGIESMETRNVSGAIPLSEIPFIMRALGYYPTEQEVIAFNFSREINRAVKERSQCKKNRASFGEHSWLLWVF